MHGNKKSDRAVLLIGDLQMQDCWPALLAEITRNKPTLTLDSFLFDPETNTEVSGNVLDLVKRKGFLTTYIVEDHYFGELTKAGWLRFEMLAQDYKRRHYAWQHDIKIEENKIQEMQRDYNGYVSKRRTATILRKRRQTEYPPQTFTVKAANETDAVQKALQRQEAMAISNKAAAISWLESAVVYRMDDKSITEVSDVEELVEATPVNYSVRFTYQPNTKDEIRQRALVRLKVQGNKPQETLVGVELYLKEIGE